MCCLQATSAQVQYNSPLLLIAASSQSLTIGNHRAILAIPITGVQSLSSSPYLELSCLVTLVLPASCLPSRPALRLCKCRPLRATHRARYLPLPMMDVMIISFVLLSLRAPLPPSRAPLRRLLSSGRPPRRPPLLHPCPPPNPRCPPTVSVYECIT